MACWETRDPRPSLKSLGAANAMFFGPHVIQQWIKQHGQEEISKLKEVVETGAKPQGASPDETTIPKEKVAAAIEDDAGESGGKQKPKKCTIG